MMAEPLGQCRAHLVARTGAETASLAQIARKTGFGEIRELSARRDYSPGEDHHINFFIVHRHLNMTMMAGVIRSIRLSSDDQIRFAPVILFAEDGPFETYLNYVHLGFDDVITLPDKQAVLVQRLTSQLWSEQVYFETRDYFGPDRRRMEAPWETDSRRAPDPHSHTRYTFVRLPAVGINITRTEIFAKPELPTGAALRRSPLPASHALR
jgi:hypothetical protein